MYYNTIRLLKGEGFYTSEEMKVYEEGDEIYGNNAEPEVIKTWDAEEKEQALEYIKERGLCCERYDGHVIEYALEYCDTDEDGEFIEGSNYNLIDEDMIKEKYGWSEQGEANFSKWLRKNLKMSIAEYESIVEGKCRGYIMNQFLKDTCGGE